jgi:hypothetical protein
MGSNNNSYSQNNKVHYSTVSVVKSNCAKTTTTKSNLVRVTSTQINSGRSQAYKHLIP